MSEKKSQKAYVTPQQKAWIGRLRPQLHTYFPHETGHLDIRIAGPPELHTNSRIYPFTLLSDGLPVADILVKTPQGRAGTDVRQAWRANQLLARHFAHEPNLRVPEMVAVWEDPPALIMKKAEGDPLNLRLQECRNWAIETGCQLAQHFVERAGQWLAMVHDMPSPSWAHPAPPPLSEIDSLMEDLRSFDIDPLEGKRIRDQLRALDDPSVASPAPLHGDYGINNILCQTPQAVTVLGAGLTASGDPAHDIGGFLASIRLIDNWQLYVGEMAYTTAVLRQTEDKFLRGYKSLRELPPMEIIRAYRTLRLLEAWVERGRQQKTRNIAGLRIFVIRRINQYFVRAILG
jgi:aminoglycoside phosphotransferase (APT) family kinase protein